MVSINNSKIFSICLIIVVIFAAVAVSANKNLPGYSDVDEQQFKNMPDIDNADDHLELSCSACSTSVGLMKNHFDKLKQEFHLHPENMKEYHAYAAIDGMCKKYGFS